MEDPVKKDSSRPLTPELEKKLFERFKINFTYSSLALSGSVSSLLFIYYHRAFLQGINANALHPAPAVPLDP
jgi:hypothetical protein